MTKKIKVQKKTVYLTRDDGSVETYLTIPALAKVLGVTKDQARYVITVAEKDKFEDYSKRMKKFLRGLNIKDIKIEYRKTDLESLTPYERAKKYITFVKMEPEKAEEYYKNIYGGNWKYNDKVHLVISDQGMAASLSPGRGVTTAKHNNNGYVRCGSSTMHKIVWETFNGPIPIGHDVDHIDDNKENNRLSNLQLLTHRENCIKRDRNGSVFNKRVYCYLDGQLIKSFASIKEGADWIMATGQCATDNLWVVKININNAIHNKRNQKYAYEYEWALEPKPME